MDDMRYTEMGILLSVYISSVITRKITSAVMEATAHLKNSYASAYLHRLSYMPMAVYIVSKHRTNNTQLENRRLLYEYRDSLPEISIHVTRYAAVTDTVSSKTSSALLFLCKNFGLIICIKESRSTLTLINYNTTN